MTDDPTEYVVGTPHPNQQAYASFSFKAPDPDSTGGGYPRWRSYEHRPHTCRQGKEDVSVSVHRLCAVAWLFPEDWSAADILQSGELQGADVHHELGMPSANVEAELSLVEHGTHSEITQAQMRAWGEQSKRQAREAVDPRGRAEVCDRCGAEAETLAECPAWPGEQRCLSCAKATSNGEPIEL